MFLCIEGDGVSNNLQYAASTFVIEMKVFELKPNVRMVYAYDDDWQPIPTTRH